MRLISICPSNTELLAYLDAVPQLVGIDDYSDWPASIQDLPRLGPDLSIRMDDLEALKPDLVIASLSVPGMEKNVEELKKRDIPHVVYNPNSLADIRANLLDLGIRLNKKELALKKIERYDQLIQLYQKLSQQVPSKNIYWEWWPKPVFTPGGFNWLTEISQLSGGRNIFEQVELASVKTDWDDVYKKNPEHICLVWVGVQKEKVNPEILQKRPEWPNLDALAKSRVHVLEESLYCRPSPRLLLGLKKIASILHPEVFPSFDGIDPLL